MEEKNMIITILAFVAGLAILAGGLYYLSKDKDDRESRKIYSITAAVGAILAIAALLKMIVW